MQTFVRISFRRMAKSASIEAAVWRWVARLEPVAESIQGLEVTIESSGGNRYDVMVVMELPEHTIEPISSSHSDVYVAIYSAFRNARKTLLGRGSSTYLAASTAF
jgi:hypothetical protein